MPPKGKRPAGPDDAFLFVNEDFSTLFEGAKNADLDRSKQSHVQRRSFAKRRKVQRGVTTSSTSSPTYSEDARSPTPKVPFIPLPPSNSIWLPTTQVADDSAGTTIAVTQSLPFFHDSTLPLWPSPTDSPFQQSPYPFAQLDPSMTDHSSLGARPTLPPLPGPLMNMETSTEPGDMFSLDSIVSTSLTDPFDNISVALEQWAPPLMRYFTMKMVPEFFHSDLRATSLHNMRHVEYIHQDMRSCMNSPAEMYALLAASACHALAREERLDLPGLVPESSDRVALLFKSKAFESLRLRLSSGELSQGVVIAIQRMICAALYTSNHSALESHYRALLSMIQAVGGLEMFNDFQKERLIMHSLSYALSTGSRPRLELTWDPGDLVADVNLELIFHINRRSSVTGGRLRSIAGDSKTIGCPTVARCVTEMVETQQVLEWLRDGPYQPAQYRWLAHRRLAIMHRLLMVNKSTLASVSRFVRLALLCYSVMVRTIPENDYPLANLYVVPELAEWKANVLTDTFKSCMDLLLWVMVMLAMGTAKSKTQANTKQASASSRRSSPQQRISERGPRDVPTFDVNEFIVETAKGVCQNLGITTKNQLRDLMKTFLFDDEFVNQGYTTFVEDGLSLEK